MKLPPSHGWLGGWFKSLFNWVVVHPLYTLMLMEEILHQLICSLSHYLRGKFIYPRCLFGIFSINSSNMVYYTPWSHLALIRSPGCPEIRQLTPPPMPFYHFKWRWVSVRHGTGHTKMIKDGVYTKSRQNLGKKANHNVPSRKRTAKAPENGWLEYDCFLLGPGLFSGANC